MGPSLIIISLSTILFNGANIKREEIMMSDFKMVKETYTDAQLHAMKVLNNRVADAIDRNMQTNKIIEEFLNSGLV